MRAVSRFSEINKNYFKKNILILGIFDGVHLGHQYLIKNAILRSKEIQASTVIFTFWPHPKEALSIIPIKERVDLFRSLGVDFCVIKKFTKNFSKLTAFEFIKLIIDKINPAEIFVGENFRFGKNREGNTRLLEKFCKAHRIKLNVVKLYRLNNETLSSSIIRKFIQKGSLEKASLFLGRPVYIVGRVKEGKALGRKLGYPTANITPFHEILPSSGAYAVEAVFKKDKFFGMAYIGTKPTFQKNNNKPVNIEAHIFDFKKNIYGKDIKLFFLKKIRSEKKFKNLTALKNQLKKDEIRVKKLFARSI